MTNRRAVAGFIIIGALWVGIVCGAIYLTWKDRTKPSVFVAPVIWSIPYNTSPHRQIDI